MLKNTTVAIVVAAALAVGGGITLAGCQEGPGERIGEKLDGHGDTMKDKLDKDGAGERAGKKVDKAIDDITK
jgi:hypothetical protein